MPKKNLSAAVFVLFLAIMLSLVKGETAFGESTPSGLLPLREIELDFWDMGEEEKKAAGEEISVTSSALFMAPNDENSWDIYTNYYVYNQLSAAERDYWDRLNEMCLSFLSTKADAIYSEANQVYYLSGASSDTLTQDEMKTVFSLFKYTNPQYYFINHLVVKFTKNGKYYISPGIYSAFAKGEARMEATKQLLSQVESWREELAKCGSEAEKVRMIHDLIVEKVSYNSRIYNSDFKEDAEYSQSAYSVFCMDTTVCAGYSQAFEMMCNCEGIASFAVTSDTHEWNKVRIDDSWYNVDCTWADQGSILYAYFERSDAYYDTASSKSAASHKEEAYWEKYLPYCTLDAVFEGNDYSAAGVLPKITEKTKEPEIFVTPQAGMSKVEIFCPTKGAVFYYTLDGTIPSSAATKSFKYEGPFFVMPQATVSVMAVCDACFDSDTVTKTLVCIHSYDVQVQNASCTADGLISYVCAYCGDTRYEIQTALGHVWDAGVVSKQPTNDAAGEKTYTCIRCHAIRTEEIAAQVTEKPGSEIPDGGMPDGGTQNTQTQNTQTQGPGTPGTKPDSGSSLKKGDKIKSGGYTYQVTKAGRNPTVRLLKASKSLTSISVPAGIKVKGVTYRVTAIAAGACMNYKKLKKVTIGKNVVTIGKKAFYGCKKLSFITIKATGLKGVGKNALKGISAAAKIKTPPGKRAKYKKLFKSGGQGKKIKFL